MSASESISQSTVRIECDLDGGGVSVGTGFWFAFNGGDDDKSPLLVTNKHVINNSTTIRARLNVSSSTNSGLRFYDLTVNGPSDFLQHPDPNIDICAFPVGGLLREIQSKGMEFEHVFFTEDDFVNQEYVSPVEEVFMTGYPNGLWDSVNNRPITRRGITASSFLEDWQGRPEFMIDMACFGGSSGSPVFIMNEGGYATRESWVLGSRLKLLGLLYAGPTVNVNGNIHVINVPTATTAVVSTDLMMNLGIVIKAEQLNGLKPLLGI